jgi:DUF4097 and DUF4098 domain-containing protein YvlB
MPKFDTPEPISVTVEAVCANLALVAGDRVDTVVEVRPTNEADEADVRAAELTRVDYKAGRLVVKGPRPRRMFSRKTESIDVRIELPTGSSVNADVTVGGCTAEGRLDECRFKTYDGHISLEETGRLRLNTSTGRVFVTSAEGHAEVTTGTGDVEFGEVHGTAVVKNLNGDTRIGSITGDLRVNSTNGNVNVDHAGGTVVVKSVNGHVVLNEVVRGSVELDVTAGDLEIGIRDGSAAWVDVNTMTGRVLNTMTPSDQPQTGDTVQVRARTYTGDIVIRRA